MPDHADRDISEEMGSRAHSHVVPVWLLVGMLLVLLALTSISVLAHHQDLGSFTAPIVFGIAIVQAALVALFFMGLLWEKPTQRIILLGALICAAVFLALCVIDTGDYDGTLDPTSPLVQEKLDKGRQSLTNPDF